MSSIGSSGQMFNGALTAGTALFSLFGGSGSSSRSAYDPGAMNMMWGLQDKNIQNEQDAINAQADIALAEARRRAAKTAREGLHFRENQAMAYNASGILLEGSPMAVLNETRKLVGEEIDAITESGFAQADLMRRKAMQVGNEGRAALLGQRISYGADQAVSRAQEIGQRPNFALQAAQFVNSMYSGSGAKPSIYSPGASNQVSGTAFGASSYGSANYGPGFAYRPYSGFNYGEDY